MITGANIESVEQLLGPGTFIYFLFYLNKCNLEWIYVYFKVKRKSDLQKKAFEKDEFFQFIFGLKNVFHLYKVDESVSRINDNTIWAWP